MPLTPEEIAEAEAIERSAPAALNPLRDLSSEDLAALAVADKTFIIADEFQRQPELHSDSAHVQKVADAFNIVKQRGFKLEDLPTVPEAAGAVGTAIKGLAGQIWNYASVAGNIAAGAISEIAGAEGLAQGYAENIRQRLDPNIAGTEEAVTGLSQLAGKAVSKTARIANLAKDFREYTPAERVTDLFDEAGKSEVRQERLTGKGEFTKAVTGAEADLDPEEVATLAAGDPLSFYLFGAGSGLAGKAIRAATPAAVRSAISTGTQAAGRAAETVTAKLGGGLVQAAGKAAEIGAKTAEVTGRAASVVGPIAGVAGALAGADIAGAGIGGLVTGTGGVALRKVGQRALGPARAITDLGRQISGSVPIKSAYARAGRDILQSIPGTVGEVAKGTALDIGLAAATAEVPQDTAGAVGFGTALGALAGAQRGAGRVLSGQLIGPREYGVSTVIPSSGQFPGLDTMHADAFKAATPGVRARLNASRQFAEGAAPGTDIFHGRDSASVERALLDTGLPPETAKLWSQQSGFFTTSLRGKDGQLRRVVIVRDVDAAPHEALHAVQDVLGEQANQKTDAIVRETYDSTWDAEGQRYAERLTGDRTNWRDAILDASGWGLLEAKEKIYRDIANRIEGETGAVPASKLVEEMAKAELGRAMDDAVARNLGVDPNLIAQHIWRDILSPQEATAVSDRYLAREIAAETFDALFKNQGPRLQEGTQLPERLARIIGGVISAFGGEPLAGRTSEFGQVPLRTPVVEAVRGVVKPRPEVSPTPRVPAGPRPAQGTPEATATAAEEARTLAQEAPTTPVVGGTRSPRELLGEVAEAIATQSGVRINYLSAPGEPAAATTSNRTTRRAIIETFRTMPAAARALWEKTFFPDRVLKTKGGKYQVQGWAPEVFAANAHKLANFLAENPSAQTLSPYAVDATTKSFTADAWQELYRDTQSFVQNQMRGVTGAGEPLVVPRSVTEAGGFAPPTRAGAVALDQGKADFINLLFNFKLPETPRIQIGRRPLNIVGQEVSQATLPGRVEVPVRPRGEFTGPEAARQGIEGRAIAEVNPLRNQLEAAAQAASKPMPSFIEAIQKLNLENIVELQGVPEVPQFRGNTLTLSAGFQPRYEAPVIRNAWDKFKLWFAKRLGGKAGQKALDLEAKLQGPGRALHNQKLTVTDLSLEGTDVLSWAELVQKLRQEHESKEGYILDFAGTAEVYGTDAVARGNAKWANWMTVAEALDTMSIGGVQEIASAAQAASPKTKEYQELAAFIPFFYASRLLSIRNKRADLIRRGEMPGIVERSEAEFLQRQQEILDSWDAREAAGQQEFLQAAAEFENQVRPSISAQERNNLDASLDAAGVVERTGRPAAQEGRAQFQAATARGRATEERGFEIRHTGSPANPTVVLLRDGAPAGEITAVRKSPTEADIAMVNVTKDFRGQGLSEILYREMGQRLQDEGVDTITSMIVNPRALSSHTKAFPETRIENTIEIGRESNTAFEVRSRIPADAQFNPVELADRVEKFAPGEFRDWVKTINNAFTQAAWEVGKQSPTREFADSLKQRYDALSRKSTEQLANIRNAEPSQKLDMLNDMSALASQAQFFREAYEAATGTASAGERLRATDPNYKPPFPLEKTSAASFSPGQEMSQSAKDFLVESEFAESYLKGSRQLRDFPYYADYEKTLRAEAELISPSGDVLFIGTGPVPISAILMEQFSGRKVHGLELLPEAAEVGTKVAKKAGNPIQVTVGDASVVDGLDKYKTIFVALEAGDTPAKKQAILENIFDQTDSDSVVLARTSASSDGFPTLDPAYKKFFEETDRIDSFGGLSQTVKLRKRDDEVATSAQFAAGAPRVETDRAKTGQAFQKFFSDVTTGKFGKSNVPFAPELPVSEPRHETFINEQVKHTGNFDEHIAKSIPTFKETQIRKGQAILEALPEGGRVLDIAASEGSLMKTVSALSEGRIETVSLDPNPEMAAFFRDKSEVLGAEYAEEAFLAGFDEIPAFNPAEKFDVINESMGFQFISPERAEQIAEAKRLLKPEGVLLTEEKVQNSNWKANEEFKDKNYKTKYFTESELKAKDTRVGFQQSKDEVKAVGMVDNMVSADSLEQTLRDNFEHVVQYWDSGNFKGYAASDSRPALNRLVEGMGDMSSKFSTEELPRNISREAQFSPRKKKAEDNYKLRPGSYIGLAKAWILPSGEPIQLGEIWHHQWLANNPEVAAKYKLEVPPFEGGDAEGVREAALKAGFARIHYTRNSGRFLVEARARDWRKIKPTVERMVESNLDAIDNMTVTLLDETAGRVVDSQSAKLFNYDDAEKLQHLPFITEGEIRGQFQPSRNKDNEISFSKGWISPDGEFYRLSDKYPTHEEWARQKADVTANASEELYKRGWLRATPYGSDSFMVNTTGGRRLSVPQKRNLADWALQNKDDLQSVIFDNGSSFDRLWTSADSAQFSPEGDLGLDVTPDTRRLQRTFNAQVTESRNKYPEAIPLDLRKEEDGSYTIDAKGLPVPVGIPYGLDATPLAKEAVKGKRGSEARDAAIDRAYADKIKTAYEVAAKNPEIAAGANWYSLAREKLSRIFGEDTKFFTELLGATSAQTDVPTNYRNAVEAYNNFKAGKYDAQIQKYREGKALWELGDQGLEPGETPFAQVLEQAGLEPDSTRAAFMKWWIDKHKLKPQKGNQTLFGANSDAVLKVLDGSWREEVQGPKTPNFANNLSGDSFEATIDIWAARLLHRLGNEGNPKRWRILPKNEKGVTDPDFFRGQRAFRLAGDELGISPDSLQAVMWFAEKDVWDKNGWTGKLGKEKSDFNVLLDVTTRGSAGGKIRIAEAELKKTGSKKEKAQLEIQFQPRVTVEGRTRGSRTITAMPQSEAEKIADAIYKAEGGAKAKKPYGILSVKVSSEAEARRVAINTIKNNWKRWQEAGRPGEYLAFLARRYAPIGAANDPTALNRNWLKNVKALLDKKTKVS